MSDFVIIGSGIAGLSCAIKAKELGFNPLVVSKTYPTKSQSSMAQGGINCADSDEIQKHIEDTVKASCGIADLDKIKYMCENAPKIIEKLESFGVPFSRNEDDTLGKRRLGGTQGKYARFAQDYSGLKILHTLFDVCLKMGVEFLNEHFVYEVNKDDRLYTIACHDLKNGKIKKIKTPSVVFATGGYSKLYGNLSTNSALAKGEALMVAKDLGCELDNLEYVQFHPTALVKNSVLISESARGEGGYLIDENGERFVDELLPRDVVARAINEKRKTGRVFLDVSHLGEDFIKSAIPQEAKLAKAFQGVDLAKEPVEIKPAAHYTLGGIKVNRGCKTNLAGVFACGECVSSSVHGANRLGGNSLLDACVFGEVAGKNAVEFVSEKSQVEITEENLDIEKYLGKDSDFYSHRDNLERLLMEKVGLERSEKDLKEALAFTKNLEKRVDSFGIEDDSKVFNTNFQDLLEFGFSVRLSKDLINSALKNKNSLGVHYRIDDEN
ncbi:MAG: FAD-binding protein [Campylobacterales bacterium]|nr:FAD-binding protein [Campylobacterales bacterium]